MSIDLAKQYAAVMDSTRYDELSSLLADDCTYSYSEGKYQGKDNIIALLRANNKQAQAVYNEQSFSSEVEDAGEGLYKIDITERIRIGPLWHETRSYEMITIRDNRIVHIGYHDIPEESEKLRLFFDRARNMNGNVRT